MSRPLLAWQQEALDIYLTAGGSGRPPERFLVAAFPGMGKTELASAIVAETDRFGIVLVAQADTLTSWRATLHGRGVCPAARVHRDAVSRTCTSCGSPVKAAVMTYDFAAANPAVVADLFAKRGPVLLVCDEVHHLRHERAWASPIVAARPYVDAVLTLSATPFRTDEEPVPFVHTAGPWTRELSPLPESCTIEYNYGRALTQKPAPVTRAVFERYDGDIRWMEDDGLRKVPKSAVLSEKNPLDLQRKARRHSLNPRGAWLTKVLQDADATLMSLRTADARGGGLVVCRDTDHAVAAADFLAQRTDGSVTVYTQDYSTRTHRPGDGRRDEESGQRPGGESGDIRSSYEHSDAKWMVTVRKVSEGVDIPRLRVLVYATVTRTELFFVQVLGRVIRVRRDLPENVDQTAWVFIPDDPEMRAYAETVENSIADAEIAAGEDDEPPERAPRQPGADDVSTERFVSADPAYAGATASGEVHEAELMALLRQVGETSADSLAMLRKLRDGGHLNTGGGRSSTEPIQGTLFDPVADLDAAKKEKNDAAKSWASFRARSGEFRSYGEAIEACHKELGGLFGVFANNADVAVEQVEKAKRHARERLKGLRRG